MTNKIKTSTILALVLKTWANPPVILAVSNDVAKLKQRAFEHGNFTDPLIWKGPCNLVETDYVNVETAFYVSNGQGVKSPTAQSSNDCYYSIEELPFIE